MTHIQEALFFISFFFLTLNNLSLYLFLSSSLFLPQMHCMLMLIYGSICVSVHNCVRFSSQVCVSVSVCALFIWCHRDHLKAPEEDCRSEVKCAFCECRRGAQARMIKQKHLLHNL